MFYIATLTPMRKKLFPSGLLLLLLLGMAVLHTSCGDDDDDPNTNSVTDGCSMPNGHLKWTSQGTQYCANATLFGDQSIDMTINGITQSGVTMTLELDSVMPGTYQMTSDVNHLLFTDQLAFDWQSTNSQPGTLIITKNDTANKLNPIET